MRGEEKRMGPNNEKPATTQEIRALWSESLARLSKRKMVALLSLIEWQLAKSTSERLTVNELERLMRWAAGSGDRHRTTH